MNGVKERMGKLGVKQVDMILALQEKEIIVQPPMLSAILRGVYTYPKALTVIKECELILNELENGRANN